MAASGGTEPSPGGEAALERGAFWVGAGDTRWPSPGITPCPSSCGPRSGTARPVGGSRPTASGACLLGQCLACHFFGWLLSPRGAGSSWQETDPWKVTLVVTRARVYWPRLSTGKEGDNKQGLVSPGGLAETAEFLPASALPGSRGLVLLHQQMSLKSHRGDLPPPAASSSVTGGWGPGSHSSGLAESSQVIGRLLSIPFANEEETEAQGGRNGPPPCPSHPNLLSEAGPFTRSLGTSPSPLLARTV